jgi:hypothetical protein
VREYGPTGLVSGRREKQSNNRLDSTTADRDVTIIRLLYPDFGLTPPREKLREYHGGRFDAAGFVK